MIIKNIKLRIFIIFIIAILVLQYAPKQIMYADSNTIKVDNSNKAAVTIKQGQYYKLPNYILMNQHGKEKKMKVHWDWSTDKVDTSIAGKIITDGTIKGYNKKVAIIISIVSVNKLSITSKNKTSLVQMQKSLYPKNKRGQTYGIPIKNASPESYPDLIPAIGDNGKQGYVLYTQLMYSPVKNPQEAVAYMKRKNKVRKIPLYKSDGVTKIGTYIIGHN